MKNIILLLTVSFLFTKCDKKIIQREILPNNPIAGTWQLFQFFDGGSPTPGSIGAILTIENGKILTFGLDNTYSNSFFPSCKGSYTLKDSLPLSLVKISLPRQCQTEELFTYSYRFENKFLILTPPPPQCIEACYFKYRRVELKF